MVCLATGGNGVAVGERCPHYKGAKRCIPEIGIVVWRKATLLTAIVTIVPDSLARNGARNLITEEECVIAEVTYPHVCCEVWRQTNLNGGTRCLP